MDDAPLQALHVPELPLVQNVFPGGVDASTHTPSSAVLLGPACGGPEAQSGSLSHGRPEAKAGLEVSIGGSSPCFVR